MRAHAVSWLVIVGILVFFLAGLGVAIKKSVFGILVDSRNKMSLSQFQVTLWTVVLTSSVFAVALANRTMNIGLDQTLWALLGISIGSASGAVLIKGQKNSLLLTASKPNWRDMFRGEEKPDFEYVDIGKVQMFLFTLAVLLGYGWELWFWNIVPTQDGRIQFPVITGELVTFLGISHAGYLTIKAAPKPAPKTAPTP